MQTNFTKQRMVQGLPAFGFELGLGSPRAAEVLAHTGIDFVQLDTQHGSFGPDSVIAALTAMAAGGATPIARVARNDYTLIGRLLDEGALGIVVPMVHTAAEAQAAAFACRYPPQGGRSWGWGRAIHYGADYPDAVNDQVFLAVQIESIRAVDNAGAILATPGVDGCWIGPSDLSLSLGVHPRDRNRDERVLAAVERVLGACQNTGKVAGYAAADADEASQLADRGFRYLTAGSDIGFLVGGAADARRRLQRQRAT